MGMRSGDLKDMVLPLISVDEYESKVDDNAVAIAFYAADIDSAKDLDRFIQNTPSNIIATDVSPAPDQRGYYMVFLEVLYNDMLPQTIMEILYEVGLLTDVDSWSMRIRKFPVEEFDEAVFKKNLKAARTEEEKIAEFFYHSDLDSCKLYESKLVLRDKRYRAEFEVIDFDKQDVVMEKMSNAALDASLEVANQCKKIIRMLGEGWDVISLDTKLVISNEEEEYCLVVNNPIDNRYAL